MKRPRLPNGSAVKRSRAQKAEALGIRLELLLPPSRRHPRGAARCEAVTWRDDQARQCRRKSRDGFPVCSHHGAGSRKRELAGVAKNPGLVRLGTGERAKPSTLQQLWQDHPEFRALYERHLNSDDLLDMRPVLAQAKALAEWMMAKIDPAAPDGEGGSPIAFKAIQSLSHVMRTARELLQIEQAIGPVTHAELERVTNAIALTIRTFVPAEQQEPALAFLRERVASGNRGPGPRPSDK